MAEVSKEVSKEDIEGVVFADDFDYDEFVSIITKHIEVQIPEKYSVLAKKELADGTREPFTDADNEMRRELADFAFDAIKKVDKPPDPEKHTVVIDPEADGPPVGPDVVSWESEPVEGETTPEIKIDLNLGSEEKVSADTPAPNEEPEMEESVEVEIPSQDEKDSPDLQVNLNDSEVTVSGPPASTSAPPTPAYADRKSHIIALVKESKWTLKQLVQIIDDQWGYAAKGKSSKTRVSKTVRDLRDNNMLYEESNGILTWRGE